MTASLFRKGNHGYEMHTGPVQVIPIPFFVLSVFRTVFNRRRIQAAVSNVKDKALYAQHTPAANSHMLHHFCTEGRTSDLCRKSLVKRF